MNKKIIILLTALLFSNIISAFNPKYNYLNSYAKSQNYESEDNYKSGKNYDILKKVITNLSIENKCMELNFTFNMYDKSGKSTFNYSGTYFSQESMYKIAGEYYEVYCDSKDKYLYDSFNNEVNIVKEDLSSGDLTENPFLILRDFNKYFKSNKGYEISEKNIATLTLIPVKENSPYSTLVLEIDLKTYYPISISYVFTNKEVYKAQIHKLSFIESKPISFFTFDKSSAPEGLYINDLR